MLAKNKKGMLKMVEISAIVLGMLIALVVLRHQLTLANSAVGVFSEYQGPYTDGLLLTLIHSEARWTSQENCDKKFPELFSLYFASLAKKGDKPCVCVTSDSEVQDTSEEKCWYESRREGSPRDVNTKCYEKPTDWKCWIGDQEGQVVVKICVIYQERIIDYDYFADVNALRRAIKGVMENFDFKKRWWVEACWMEKYVKYKNKDRGCDSLESNEYEEGCGGCVIREETNVHLSSSFPHQRLYILKEKERRVCFDIDICCQTKDRRVCWNHWKGCGDWVVVNREQGWVTTRLSVATA